MFIPGQRVLFLQHCNRVHPKHALWFLTAAGKSATAVTTVSVLCAQKGWNKRHQKQMEIACAGSFHTSLFCHVVFSSQLINLGDAIIGCSPMTKDVQTSGHLAWLCLTQQEAPLGCFMILNPVQICICPIQGCVAHMFPLIKHKTHAWRKQETQNPISYGPQVSINAEVRWPAAIRLCDHFAPSGSLACCWFAHTWVN